ncbi:MAG: Ig-like domain-containing protein [Paludibacter sp.]|nr:Ig-like domain-containing protein [Paludibacter sp.]
MKRLFTSAISLILFLGLFASTPDFSMVGFATLNGGTTGGAGGTEITVTTYEQLKAAVFGTSPKIVYVVGKIEVVGGGDAIEVGSNTSIIGVGNTAMISQVQLYLKNASNVIIRNLKFTALGSTKGSDSDCISIATTSSGKCSNIWIDHCEFFNVTPIRNPSASVKDKYDGLIDIKKTSEYITISWCYFRDHYKGILVGYTDSDTYDRKITFVNNKFERVYSRLPSYRGGTGHIFNNYYVGSTDASGIFGDGVNTREGACLLVENNYFLNMSKGVYCAYADVSVEGFAYGSGNEYVNSTMGWDPVLKSCNSFTPPYTYTKLAANELPALLDAWTGVGKIDDVISNVPPVVTLTAPTQGASLDAEPGILFTADATDSDGTVLKVDFYANGLFVGTDTTSPYSYIWNSAVAGNYNLTAVATDNLGATASSAAVNVNITGTGTETGGENPGENTSEIETTGNYHLQEMFTTGTGRTDYGTFTTNLNTVGTLCKYYPTTANTGYTGYALIDKKRATSQAYVTLVEVPNCGEIEIISRASSARNITLEKKIGSTWEVVDAIDIASAQVWSPDKAKTLSPVQFRITTTNTGGDVYLYQVLISEGRKIADEETNLIITNVQPYNLYQSGNKIIIGGDRNISHVRILTVSGSLIVESTNSNELVLENIGKGIYLAQITDGAGKSVVQKFVRL